MSDSPNKHRGSEFIFEEQLFPVLTQVLSDGDVEEVDAYLNALIEDYGRYQVQQWLDAIESDVYLD